MKDHPATAIHRALYQGRSDLANAPENRSADWQAGYTAGLDYDGQLCDRTRQAWIAHGCPQEGAPAWEPFTEWKRGFYAAVMQKLFARRATKN